MPLVLVPTPLGNLRDVTLRALDVLRDADLIVAEDTRVARKLLQALGLPGRELWSYREQNADGATAAIVERARHELVALTSDAGMPSVSDPGSRLVAAARSAGVGVEALPGPSAAFGAAALSGFPLQRFSFEGFPPRSSRARRAAFARALRGESTTVWFESPHRIRQALADLAAAAPGAEVFLVREYTKLHEQQLLGSPATVAAGLPEPPRGEIAFAVAPYRFAEESPSDAELDAAIDAMLQGRCRVAEIAKRLAQRGLGDRTHIYARAAARKAAGKGGTPPAESPQR